MSDTILELLCVKTDKGCFIANASTSYNRKPLKPLLFNGKSPSASYHPDWYYLEEYPTTIQQTRTGGIIDRRYEIIDESLISEKLPAVIPYEEESGYADNIIKNLYTYKYTVEPDYLEEVEYNIQIVCEIADYDFPPIMEYEAITRNSFSDRQYTIKNIDVQHQLLDKMLFPPMLLHERPCKFTSKQMYDITRQYILTHIDNSVAEITSNYDFCFEVKKLIPLIEPETITYQNIFARTKRERNKIHTTVKKYEKKTIFQMTHNQENYRGYTAIPELCANNETELKEKVDTWLEGLIEVINKPLCQCPHCQGTGFIDDIKTEGFSYIKES